MESNSLPPKTLQEALLETFSQVKMAYLEKYKNFTPIAKQRRDLSRIDLAQSYAKMSIYKEFNAIVVSPEMHHLAGIIMQEIIDQTITRNSQKQYVPPCEYWNVLFYIFTGKDFE